MTDHAGAHTPGPWIFDKLEGCGSWVRSAIPGKAYTALACGASHEEANANARLIASAPAMAEELGRLRALKAQLVEALKSIANGDEYYGEYKEIARAAILAAEGEVEMGEIAVLSDRFPPRAGPMGELQEERCHANRNGVCFHANCPQVRDGEPAGTGRHCPIDTWDEDDG